MVHTSPNADSSLADDPPPRSRHTWAQTQLRSSTKSIIPPACFPFRSLPPSYLFTWDLNAVEDRLGSKTSSGNDGCIAHVLFKKNVLASSSHMFMSNDRLQDFPNNALPMFATKFKPPVPTFTAVTHEELHENAIFPLKWSTPAKAPTWKLDFDALWAKSIPSYASPLRMSKTTSQVLIGNSSIEMARLHNKKRRAEKRPSRAVEARLSGREAMETQIGNRPNKILMADARRPTLFNVLGSRNENKHQVSLSINTSRTDSSIVASHSIVSANVLAERLVQLHAGAFGGMLVDLRRAILDQQFTPPVIVAFAKAVGNLVSNHQFYIQFGTCVVRCFKTFWADSVCRRNSRQLEIHHLKARSRLSKLYVAQVLGETHRAGIMNTAKLDDALGSMGRTTSRSLLQEGIVTALTHAAIDTGLHQKVISKHLCEESIFPVIDEDAEEQLTTVGNA